MGIAAIVRLLQFVLPLLISTFATTAAAAAEDGGKRLYDLISSNEFDAARRHLRQQLKGRRDIALHAAHLEGLIAMQMGEHERAILIFRKILTVEPQFDPSRMALARALNVSGDREASRLHLEMLANGSQDSDLQQFAARTLRAMNEHRSHGASLQFSLLPSTNVNRGTSNSTFNIGPFEFIIDDNSRKTSGLGVSMGGNAFKNFRVDDKRAITLRGGANLKKYKDTNDYDDATLSLGLDYRRIFGWIATSVGPAVRYKFAAGDPHMLAYGLAGGVNVPVGSRSQAGAAISVMHQDYVDLDYRDGPKVSTNFTLQHLLSASTRLAGTIAFEFERTDRPHLDHNDILFKLEAHHEWRGGLITSAFASYQPSYYDGDFPTTGEPRTDHEYSIGGRVAHRSFSIGGFAPQLTYEYTTKSSNVSFYDHESHDVGLSMTRNF
jgi:hypothetical protein